MLLRAISCRPCCNFDSRLVVVDGCCLSISFPLLDDAVAVVVVGCFTLVIVASINRDERHENDKTKDVKK